MPIERFEILFHENKRLVSGFLVVAANRNNIIIIASVKIFKGSEDNARAGMADNSDRRYGAAAVCVSGLNL